MKVDKCYKVVESGVTDEDPRVETKLWTAKGKSVTHSGRAVYQVSHYMPYIFADSREIALRAFKKLSGATSDIKIKYLGDASCLASVRSTFTKP